MRTEILHVLETASRIEIFSGAEYGGESKLFYSQFELHTREQKINQIILLEVSTFPCFHSFIDIFF